MAKANLQTLASARASARVRSLLCRLPRLVEGQLHPRSCSTQRQGWPCHGSHAGQWCRRLVERVGRFGAEACRQRQNRFASALLLGFPKALPPALSPPLRSHLLGHWVTWGPMLEQYILLFQARMKVASLQNVNSRATANDQLTAPAIR